MSSQIRSIGRVWLIGSAVMFIAGCWGLVWPQRTVVIDLPSAKATIEDVQKFADQYLLAHQFKPMGKAGYDTMRGTSTIFDYEGPDGLIASVGPEGTRDLSKCKAVSISFNQDRKTFSPQANETFNAFVKAIGEKWPGAVKETFDRQKAGDISK